MRIGIIGSGQLARMLAQAGAALGHTFAFLTDEITPTTEGLGEHFLGNTPEIWAKFAQNVDLVTFENENISTTLLDKMAEFTPVFPDQKALGTAQERLAEKDFFTHLDIPCANYYPVANTEDLFEAAKKLGLPIILKSRRHGYDGKGQSVFKTQEAVQLFANSFEPNDYLAEAMIPFDREVSIIASRNTQGETIFYDLCENTHKGGILLYTKNKTHDPAHPLACRHLKKIIEDLNYVGTITLECFQVGDTLLANEFSPRVHNSGHWTIEGAETSQFENHIRAITGASLGSPRSLAPTFMVNLLGALPEGSSESQVFVHNYLKPIKPDRKVGHLTLTTTPPKTP